MREENMPLYPNLVRHVLMPLALWRRGELAQRRYEREFERTQFLSSGELRDLQWRRLRTLLAHAYAHCPFYRQRFEERGAHPGDLRNPEDLRRVLPPLE